MSSQTIASRDPAPGATTDALAALQAGRSSCRAFRADAVPHETIEAILTGGQQAASWCNSQPWQVIVTEGAGTERFREALFAHAQSNPKPTPDIPFPERYEGIYKARQRECAWQLYSSLGIEHGDRVASGRQALKNFRLFGAPHVAVITSERLLGTYGVLDCGGYVANFLLAARSHGVSTIAQAALAVYGSFIRDYFSIPEDRLIVCGISFGYADQSHPANSFRTNREPIENVVTWVGN